MRHGRRSLSAVVVSKWVLRSLVAASVTTSLGASRRAEAWIFSEHTRTARVAGSQLSIGERKVLSNAWSHATKDAQAWARRVWTCRETIAGDVIAPSCIDFGVLSALAGDHSCSPYDLANALGNSRWVDDVLVQSERTRRDLMKAGDHIEQRIEARRELNVQLQLADVEYSNRARASNAHFQLARKSGEAGSDGSPDLTSYLHYVLTSGQPVNATALYVNYHAAAIRSAVSARGCDRAGYRDTCNAIYRQSILAEAFALHFLQDSFSSGHIAGSWGEESQRMGTHDYYCRNGLDARTWRGAGYIAYGDGFLNEENLSRTSQAVKRSISQWLYALDPATSGTNEMNENALRTAIESGAILDFDSCNATRAPAGLFELARAQFIQNVLVDQPIPAPQIPELPRFQNEIGGFIGPAVNADMIENASMNDAKFSGPGWRARMGFRIGGSFDGIATRYMETHLFGEALFAAQYPAQIETNAIARSATGIGARIHAPYLVVPFDGILAMPMALAFKDSPFWVGWATRAAAGGPGQWQRIFLLSERTTFQFVLGRDASILYYRNEVDGVRDRFELVVPVAVLKYGAPYAAKVSTDGGIELGGQLITLQGGGNYVGAYLSLFSSTRLYF